MIFKQTIKAFCWLISLTIFVCIVLLLTTEQTIPDFILDRVISSLSGKDYALSVDSVKFKLTRGIRIKRIKVIDKSTATPIVQAHDVDMRLNLMRLPWSLKKMISEVTITDLSYPRLPESYYIPHSQRHPGEPDYKESNDPVEFDMPVLKPFKVKLIRPDILSLRVAEATFDDVSCNGRRFAAKNFTVVWPDTDVKISVSGTAALDLNEQKVTGTVRGLTRQANIRPMLERIDIQKALPFIDAFTGVQPPIDVTCTWDVNLKNGDLQLGLDLAPFGGAYNNVPMRRATSKLMIRVFVRDTFQNAQISIGPIFAVLEGGATMSGSIFYESTNDINTVTFDNVASTAPLQAALNVADVLNDGTLDCLKIASVPRIEIDGKLAVFPEDHNLNDLKGRIAFRNGSLFGVELKDVDASFHFKDTKVTFPRAEASAAHGGIIAAEGSISIPDMSSTNASFAITVACTNVPIQDVANALKFELGDRNGNITGDIRMTGPLGGDLTTKLNASGHIECTNGNLARLNLFAGFTDYLAANIPGVRNMLTQTGGSLDYKVKDGVFSTKNILVEGDLFSIRGGGSYDIAKDNLDLALKVQLFKKSSLKSILLSPINIPVGELIEFHVFGSLDHPSWKTKYAKPLKILSGLIPGISNDEKNE